MLIKKGKKTRGRSRQMMLDWMMADGYGKLKEEPNNERSGDIIH